MGDGTSRGPVTLSREEVQELALLARVRLTEAEADRLRADLGKILGYVEKLQSLDTTGVEPMTHAVPMDCPLRPDRVAPSLPQEVALSQAPARDGEFFEVPRIINTGGEG